MMKENFETSHQEFYFAFCDWKRVVLASDFNSRKFPKAYCQYDNPCKSFENLTNCRGDMLSEDQGRHMSPKFPEAVFLRKRIWRDNAVIDPVCLLLSPQSQTSLSCDISQLQITSAIVCHVQTGRKFSSWWVKIDYEKLKEKLTYFQTFWRINFVNKWLCNPSLLVHWSVHHVWKKQISNEIYEIKVSR